VDESGNAMMGLVPNTANETKPVIPMAIKVINKERLLTKNIYEQK
jgi:hypothetical protein